MTYSAHEHRSPGTENLSTQPQWETILDDGLQKTQRLAVPGGWLYLVTVGSHHIGLSATATFVPDKQPTVVNVNVDSADIDHGRVVSMLAKQSPPA